VNREKLEELAAVAVPLAILVLVLCLRSCSS
jgi:hypothetical protein